MKSITRDYTQTGQAWLIFCSLSPAICYAGKKTLDDVSAGDPREGWVPNVASHRVRTVVKSKAAACAALYTLAQSKKHFDSLSLVTDIANPTKC